MSSTPPTIRSDLRSALLFTGLMLALAGCQRIPEESYGVERVRVLGTKKIDELAVTACLATKERRRVGFGIGTPMGLDCGEPPFDGARIPVRLWFSPFDPWPVFDQHVFSRDLERVERFYRARGFYDAEVTGSRVLPASAARSDRFDADDPPCEDAKKGRGCPARVEIRVVEGEPVLVTSLDLDGGDRLGEDIKKRVRRRARLKVGERFDEAYYEALKEDLRDELRREGYACASVSGEVRLDPLERKADVSIAADRGPLSELATIAIEIDGESRFDIPTKTIRAAADLKIGDRYSPMQLADAQQSVYALGGFSSVEVIADTRRDETKACTGAIDATIKVRPGKVFHYGVGGGVQSGTFHDQGTTDVSQWDLHLLAFVEHRNFLGGLRRLRIEERPKIVFQDLFPIPRDIAPGNDLRIEFRQPAFIEARTTLTMGSRWDVGPDPIQRSVYRHELDTFAMVSRSFFGGRLLISAGLRSNLYRVIDRYTPEAIQYRTSPYHLMLFEQRIQLDLRDDARKTTRGAFFQLGLQEAGYILPSSWDYLRVTPEARGYLPLPFGLVLAAKFGLGMTFIQHADDSLDPASYHLGPTGYRLRGGGPTSHRGFLPGTLGERGEHIPGASPNHVYLDIDGGTRRWEASLELRSQITRDLGIVFFGDMGDVSRPVYNPQTETVEDARFRFDRIHLAVGIGFRYFTLVGPIRLDIGVLVPGAQIIGEPDGYLPNALRLRNLRVPGTLILSLGEAF